MSDGSTIEWTDASWNPTRGCTKISPGCKHCYAETFAERFRGVSGHPYEQGFDFRLVPKKLTEPLNWKRPRRIFVNSMSDLFHEKMPMWYLDRVFTTMKTTPRHTYQILTKRPLEMRDYVLPHVDFARDYPNVWLGVSVEDREYGLPRVDVLKDTPAAIRFLSVEPLLEDLGDLDLAGIDWVIVGGESGHGARPMHHEWARSVRDQCQEQNVPFFFKQWGTFSPGSLGEKKGGRLLDGRTWSEFPDAKTAVRSPQEELASQAS